MKKYNITVNGITYEVEVEEVGAVSAPAQTAAPAPAPIPAAAPAAAPAPKPAPAPSAPAAAPSAGAETLNCPMPGTILDIRVNPGDAVSAGQVLLILEAMKMENEIVAPASGTIDTIQVSKGASVNAGDILLSIK